jgi:hypothetical protein
LEVLLNLLTPGKSPLAKIAGLKPVEILIHEKEMRFCALRTQSNAIIPFAPLKVDYAETVKNPHPIFVELMKKGAGAKPIVMLPWNEDIRFLRSGYESSDVAMDVVPDAVVEEAYNYLRISLSEWLATKEGKHTHRQLRGLKQAQLPLYEKRRRGDILLEPLIHNWLDTSSHKEAIPTLSLLRRNCIVESKESCAKTRAEEVVVAFIARTSSSYFLPSGQKNIPFPSFLSSIYSPSYFLPSGQVKTPDPSILLFTQVPTN